MPWYDNVDWFALLGAGVSAYAGYQGAQQQNDFINQASGPQPFERTDVTEAHPSAFPWLEGAFEAAQQNYQDANARAEQALANMPRGGGGGGGGRGGFRPIAGSLDWGGSSPESQQVRGAMVDRATGGSPFVDQAQQAALGMMGGGGRFRNPYLDQVFGAAMGDRTTPAAASFMGALSGAPREGYGMMQSFLGDVAGGAQQAPPTGAAVAPAMQAATAPPGAAGGPPTKPMPPGVAPAPSAPLSPRDEAIAKAQQQRATQDRVRSMEAAARAGDPSAARAVKQPIQPDAPPPAPGAGAGQGAAPAPAATSGPLAWTGQGNLSNDDLWENGLNDLMQGRYLDYDSNPHLQEYMSQLTAQGEASRESAVSGLNSQAQGAGMYGSSFYQGARGEVEGAMADSLNRARTQALMGNYEAERGRMMGGLDALSGRYNTDTQADIAMKQIAAQKEAQNASAAMGAKSSAMAANAQQQALEAQERMHGQSLQLSGLQSLLGYEQGNLGLWGDAVGQNQSSADYGLGVGGQVADLYGQQQLGFQGLGQQGALSALGMVPGLEQAGYYGLESALRGSGGLDQLDTQAAQAGSGAQMQEAFQAWQAQQSQAANRNAAAQRQWQQEQALMNAPQQNFNQLLQQMLALSGGIGQVSQSSGSSAGTPPGPYVNPALAALQAGAGTWFSRPG